MFLVKLAFVTGVSGTSMGRIYMLHILFLNIEPERKRIGLTAQEVELIVPEVVRMGDDDLKSIEYQNLVGLLNEAIKDQQKQN
jgi:hypothetical protein